MVQPSHLSGFVVAMLCTTSTVKGYISLAVWVFCAPLQPYRAMLFTIGQDVERRTESAADGQTMSNSTSGTFHRTSARQQVGFCSEIKMFSLTSNWNKYLLESNFVYRLYQWKMKLTNIFLVQNKHLPFKSFKRSAYFYSLKEVIIIYMRHLINPK